MAMFSWTALDVNISVFIAGATRIGALIVIGIALFAWVEKNGK
jgi:hypothetical protein